VEAQAVMLWQRWYRGLYPSPAVLPWRWGMKNTTRAGWFKSQLCCNGNNQMQDKSGSYFIRTPAGYQGDAGKQDRSAHTLAKPQL